MTAAGERNEAVGAAKARAASSAMTDTCVNASDSKPEQRAMKPKPLCVVDRDAATTSHRVGSPAAAGTFCP